MTHGANRVDGVSVRIDGAGRFIVGGEPFFPIGLYSVPWAADFPALRAAGFNTVHSYEFERELFVNLQSRERAVRAFDGLDDVAARAYLDAARKNGLQVLMGFPRPSGAEPDIFTTAGQAQMAARVRSLRDHPALLGWYLVDEPDGQDIEPAVVARAGAAVAALDPEHPTLTVLCVPDRFPAYGDSADVLMFDSYPVPREPLAVVGDGAARLKSAAGAARATVAVLQAFDWCSYHWQEADTRPPTLTELRCMCWQAVAAGASGILFFNYCNERHSNRAADNPAGWEMLRAIAAELEAMTSWLLAPRCAGYAAQGTLMLTFRQVGDEVVVLAVNPTAEPGSAVVEIPDGRPVRIVAAAAGAPVPDQAECGRFRIDLVAHAVRALRLQPCP